MASRDDAPTLAGVIIHDSHPFATPGHAKDAARRLRGRLASSVTVWACGAGPARAGLTVSSLLVALGEQPRLVGLVDPDSDLAAALDEVFAVSVLQPSDQVIADAFAGLAPAPGGLFRGDRFTDSAWGPVLVGRSWAGVRLESARELGWSLEVVGTIEHVALVDGPVLGHVRGGYLPL